MAELTSIEKRKLMRRTHDQSHYHWVVKRVNCTLTKDEYQLLYYKARAAGYKPTTYLKHAAIAYLRNKYIVPVQFNKKLHKFTVIMRNIGRNINALATKAHKSRKVREVDFRKLEKLVYHLEEQVKQFIRNPKRKDVDLFDEP